MSNIPKFREYTKKELEAINELFTPYLFYKDTDHKHRHCICTCCRQEYDVTSDNYELFTARHNEKAVCAKCGNTVTAKSIGKAKTCKNLREEQRVVTIYRVDEKTVHIKADEFVKSYFGSVHNPEPKVYNSSRYILKPRNIKQFIYSYYYGWAKRENFGEPFYIKNNGGFWSTSFPDNSYTIFGLSKLENTFLKYNMLNEYERHYCQHHRQRSPVYIKYITYLCQFAMYPQIEMLQKLGYYDIVFNLVELKNKSYPYVNWGAENVTDFFKLTKQEFKKFRQNDGDLKLLKMIWVMKKHFKSKTPIRSALEMTEAIQGGYIQAKAEVLRYAISDIKKEKLPIIETVKYLIKKQNQKKDFTNVKQEYFDYYRMGKDLKYDFANHNVLYPKALTRAHDLANETHTIWLEEQEAKREAERDKKTQSMLKKKDKQYFFTDGKYIVTVPHSTKEILEEGRVQKHCVGGYAGRHMEGRLTILFLRLCSEPEKALYTIEMHNKSLTQVQGYNNRTPLTPEAKLFFESWLKWVKDGSKRDEKGNPITQTEKVKKSA